ncbi:hypothetical protein BASA81_010155 [Batrachochytrium salamandrivorans]|nr:hypothetical protein BASA81_010155 [Batrachochytrium salamandrivorans]
MPIFNQNPELVASIITLLTYDLAYRHVHPLMMATDAKRQNSQPVKDMIRMFKVYSYWPLTCILEDDLKLGEVFDRLLFFLAVAEQLRRLSNFHALFAIVGGLTQPFMSWVWTALPPTHKAHKRFGDLKRLISSNGDYRVYKADLSHCQGKSRIPFLGVSLRMLVQLEMEPAQPEAHHPQLYHFSRQVARSAAINDFVGGQRHPYQCLNGTAFSIVSGPPGPSPYMLVDGGTVSGSKHAQFPPSSATQGVYSPSLLGTGLEPVSLRVSSTAIQVEDKRAYSGMVELLDELDLKLALCYSISITQEESALREISTDVQRALLAV